MKRLQDRKGFTLPEVLIAAAFVGLSGILVAAVFKHSVRSQRTTELQDDLTYLRAYLRDNVSCRTTMVQQPWGHCKDLGTNPNGTLATQPIVLNDRWGRALNPGQVISRWQVVSNCDNRGLNILARRLDNSGSALLAGASGIALKGPTAPLTPLYRDWDQASTSERLCADPGLGPDAARAQIWANDLSGPGVVAVKNGDPVSIKWSSLHAKSCSVASSSALYPVPVSDRSNPGVVFVKSAPSTFTVTCQGEDGYPATASVTIN